MAEYRAEIVKKVLPLDMGDGSLLGRLDWHGHAQEDNPTEAFRRVSRVGSSRIIGESS
jgi:hypothetical protein